MLKGDRNRDDSATARGQGKRNSNLSKLFKLTFSSFFLLNTADIGADSGADACYDQLLQLEESEQRQRELQTTRLALEKEITVKKNSISIDRWLSSS